MRDPRGARVLVPAIRKAFGILCQAGAIGVGLATVSSAAPAGWFSDHFIDPGDDYFDMSSWLGQKTGFLPVPIIVTEPAVGYGGGLAAVFFHGKVIGRQTDDGRLVPPSISGVALAATENGSEIAGGFHFGVWNDDHLRYTGILGAASLNLTFYGLEVGVASRATGGWSSTSTPCSSSRSCSCAWPTVTCSSVRARSTWTRRTPSSYPI
jgi:hypothetical protein